MRDNRRRTVNHNVQQGRQIIDDENGNNQNGQNQQQQGQTQGDDQGQQGSATDQQQSQQLDNQDQNGENDNDGDGIPDDGVDTVEGEDSGGILPGFTAITGLAAVLGAAQNYSPILRWTDGWTDGRTD